MATISKKEVHKFLDKDPDIPFSAAKFEYSLYLEPEAVEYAIAISEKMLGESEEDLRSKRMIEQAETTLYSKNLVKSSVPSYLNVNHTFWDVQFQKRIFNLSGNVPCEVSFYEKAFYCMQNITKNVHIL